MSFHLILEDQKRQAHLVCHAPSARTKVRGFLRELGIRPHGERGRWRSIAEVKETFCERTGSVKRHITAPRRGGSGFVDLYAPRMRTSLAVYRLTGDDWIRIRTVELPATDWGRLAQLGFGAISVGQALP